MVEAPNSAWAEMTSMVSLKTLMGVEEEDMLQWLGDVVVDGI
jgi:hypothetical protein